MSDKDVMKSIRFHKEKDKDLLEFFNDKGLKYGIKFLYDFYENNRDIASNIIDVLKNEIDFSSKDNHPTKITKKISTKFNFDDDELDMSKF